MNFKKILAVTLMICLSFGVFALVSPEALATDISDGAEIESEIGSLDVSATFDVNYDASDEYKNSKYYENLKKVPKSGNQAVNVVAIALSQVGYHEGDSEADFGGFNSAGTGDFVEYNVLIGKLYDIDTDSNTYGYAWCATFVTWCLRQAEVDPEQSAQTEEFNEKYKTTYRSCWQWKKAFEEAERFHLVKESDDPDDNEHYDPEYEPQMGDIIFFNDEETNQTDASHVGIVIYSDGENIYTVEGNANTIMGEEQVYDSVAIKTHPLDSKYIVGYGQPAYENTEEEEPYGWRDVENPDASPMSVEKLLDDAKGGVQIIPVWEKDVPIAKIVVAAILALLLVAVVTVIAIMTFKKKPDDRNSGRHKENKKSRNKYHGKNKGAKRK